MANSITNTLMLLGGAGLGAVTMYLLDPDKGSTRRERIGSEAERAVESAHDALQAKLSGVGHYAGHAASQLRDRAVQTASDVSQQAHGVADSARTAAGEAIHAALGTAHSYSDQAQNYSTDAAGQARAAVGQARAAHERLRAHLSDRASSLLSRGRASVREQVAPSHPYTVASEVTAGSVALLIAGAGAMYFLDPTRGASRRAVLRDKLSSATRRTGKSARQYGRHVGNRLKGAAHHLQGAVENAGQTATV